MHSLVYGNRRTLYLQRTEKKGFEGKFQFLPAGGPCCRDLVSFVFTVLLFVLRLQRGGFNFKCTSDLSKDFQCTVAGAVPLRYKIAQFLTIHVYFE